MIFRASLFVLMCIFSTNLFASEPEWPILRYLIYNGRVYLLHTNIMLFRHFDKHPEKGPDRYIKYTYSEIYEIKNNELFMKDIIISPGFTMLGMAEFPFGEKASKSLLPESYTGQSALKIDWFSGFLIVPANDIRQYPCAQPGLSRAVYESYILIEIKNGNFVKEKRMNCLEFQQFVGKQKYEKNEYVDWIRGPGYGRYYEQHPEYLIYNNKEYILYTEPLHEYLKKHPEKQPKALDWSTSLRRGYIGTYEIKNNELFLKDIGLHVDSREDGKPVLKSALPEFIAGKSALKIDWFSGFLIIPDGETKRTYWSCVTSNITGGVVTSHYENYIIIEIKNGNFVKETRMNCLEYRRFRNDVFKENNELYEWNEYNEWCELNGGCSSRELK